MPGRESAGAIPLVIPVAMGLLDEQGRALPARLKGENESHTGTRVLLAREAETRFVFEDVASRPVASLLRGFSAPVKLSGVADDDLRVLAAHDTDPFVRWESGQQLACGILLRMVETRETTLRWTPDLPRHGQIIALIRDSNPIVARQYVEHCVGQFAVSSHSVWWPDAKPKKARNGR